MNDEALNWCLSSSIAVDTSTFTVSLRLRIVIRCESSESQMFSQLDAVVVTYYSAGSVRQFFLEDEVLLNLHPLRYRRSLNLRTRGTVTLELYWLFIYGN